QEFEVADETGGPARAVGGSASAGSLKPAPTYPPEERTAGQAFSRMVDDLSGKTVLLTGASTGLGPHIARRLRESGAKFVLSARNEAALEKLADELGESQVIAADLSRTGEPERLAAESGHVDVLVSN